MYTDQIMGVQSDHCLALLVLHNVIYKAAFLLLQIIKKGNLT